MCYLIAVDYLMINRGVDTIEATKAATSVKTIRSPG